MKVVVLLDTCFLIDLSHHEAGAVGLLKALEAESTPMLVPSLALFEFMNVAKEPTAGFRALESSTEILDFTAEDVREAIRVVRDTSKKGKFPGWIDAMIAGTSIARGGIPIVTRNGKHFPGCETRTY